MQDLENNDWIILDSLRNIYEIYANHYWITQAELCLKGTFVKASVIFVTIF